MKSKTLFSSNIEDYRELIKALEFDVKQVENMTKETVEKLDRMLEDDLFNRTNIKTVESLARESVVNVPCLIDNKIIINNDPSQKFNLVIKSNERLEILIDFIKHESFLFNENAEKIHVLIELNYMSNDETNYDMQSSWKKELVQMQGCISSNHMDILTYYRNRSQIGFNILKKSRINDYWEQLSEIDQDFFIKLRGILYNLRLFNLRLYHIVYYWIYFSTNIG